MSIMMINHNLSKCSFQHYVPVRTKYNCKAGENCGPEIAASTERYYYHRGNRYSGSPIMVTMMVI